jgi:quinol-cytochrome oxidoreductase complex cytochrome b subunit
MRTPKFYDTPFLCCAWVCLFYFQVIMDEDDLQEAPRPIQHSKARPIIISVLLVFVIAIVVGSVVLGAQLASKREPNNNGPNPTPSPSPQNPPQNENPPQVS